jgi:hypothetical protein
LLIYHFFVHITSHVNKDADLLLEKKYTKLDSCFSLLLTVWTTFEILAGYRVSMDREETTKGWKTNNGNTLAETILRQGRRGQFAYASCCSCNLELVVDVGVVVFTTSVTGSLQIVGRLSIVLGHSTLLVATECVSTEV